MNAWGQDFGNVAPETLRSVDAIEMRARDHAGRLNTKPSETDWALLSVDDSEIFEHCGVLQAIINSLPDIYLVTDVEGNVLEANPTALAIASRKRLIGRNISRWVIPGHLRNLRSLLQKAANPECESSDLYDDLWLRCEDTAETFSTVSARVWRGESKQHGRLLYWILR